MKAAHSRKGCFCKSCEGRRRNARTPLEFFLGLPVPRKKPILHNNNEDNEKRYPAACFKRGMWTDEAEMHRVTAEMADG